MNKHQRAYNKRRRRRLTRQKRYAARKLAGRCTRCGTAPAREDAGTCAPCGRQVYQSVKLWRARQRAAGRSWEELK